MMMQMNQLICIALMSSFFLASASAIYAPVSDEVKGWTVVFKLFDTKSNGYIKKPDMDKFFAKPENARFFNDSTKGEMYKQITPTTEKVTYDMFIKLMGDRKITTLQALEKAFPGQERVLGKDLNKRFNLYIFFRFSEKQKYTLQEAAKKIDDLLINHYYRNKIFYRKRRSITTSSSSSFI